MTIDPIDSVELFRRRNPERFQRALEFAALGPCLLCGSAEHGGMIGVFAPNNPWEFCANPPVANKERYIAYRVCATCWERVGLENAPAAAEAILRAQIRFGEVLP